MKKIALISVLVTYLVLNLGISMKFHYCGDSISFIDFFPIEEKTCCGGKKPSCCKDKLAYVNPETTQDTIVISNFEFTDYAKFNLAVQDFSFLSALESLSNNINALGFRQEFFNYKVPLYLRNRVLRI